MARLGDRDDIGYHESEVMKRIVECIMVLIVAAMVCATVSCVFNGMPRM